MALSNMVKSDLELELEFHMKALNIKKWEREYTFAKPRRWRFDFAWIDDMVAAEVEGGIWSGVGMSLVKGFNWIVKNIIMRHYWAGVYLDLHHHTLPEVTL